MLINDTTARLGAWNAKADPAPVRHRASGARVAASLAAQRRDSEARAAALTTEKVTEANRIRSAIQAMGDKDAARYIIVTWARKFGSIHPNDVYDIYEDAFGHRGGKFNLTYSEAWRTLRHDGVIVPKPGAAEEQNQNAGNGNKKSPRFVLR